MIATGSRPRELRNPGHELFRKNIYYLRNVTDSNAIAAEAADKKVVIVGTSFIGEF